MTARGRTPRKTPAASPTKPMSADACEPRGSHAARRKRQDTRQKTHQLGDDHRRGGSGRGHELRGLGARRRALKRRRRRLRRGERGHARHEAQEDCQLGSHCPRRQYGLCAGSWGPRGCDANPPPSRCRRGIYDTASTKRRRAARTDALRCNHGTGRARRFCVFGDPSPANNEPRPAGRDAAWRRDIGHVNTRGSTRGASPSRAPRSPDARSSRRLLYHRRESALHVALERAGGAHAGGVASAAGFVIEFGVGVGTGAGGGGVGEVPSEAMLFFFFFAEAEATTLSL